MVDLLYELFPNLPPQAHGLMTAAVRALEEWLFFAFFALGVTAFVRLLLYCERK
jgi:hypothetical protein